MWIKVTPHVIGYHFGINWAVACKKGLMKWNKMEKKLRKEKQWITIGRREKKTVSPRVELGPPGWKPGILIARPYGRRFFVIGRNPMVLGFLNSLIGLPLWAAVIIDRWQSFWALVEREKVQAACIRKENGTKLAHELKWHKILRREWFFLKQQRLTRN